MVTIYLRLLIPLIVSETRLVGFGLLSEGNRQACWRSERQDGEVHVGHWLFDVHLQQNPNSIASRLTFNSCTNYMSWKHLSYLVVADPPASTKRSWSSLQSSLYSVVVEAVDIR